MEMVDRNTAERERISETILLSHLVTSMAAENNLVKVVNCLRDICELFPLTAGPTTELLWAIRVSRVDINFDANFARIG